jgi:hypothetical protein
MDVRGEYRVCRVARRSEQALAFFDSIEPEAQRARRERAEEWGLSSYAEGEGVGV